MSKSTGLLLVLLSGTLAGCGSGAHGQAAKGTVKNGLYVDASNVPLCPVTGDPIANGKEVGKTVFNGVEYHFCCGGCPETFKANPTKYAFR